MSIHWDTAINDRLGALHLQARAIVWGMHNGIHRSSRVTRSIEFVEHKDYHPGDPISLIDWKVYAKNDRLMIRKQQADTEAQLVLVLDASADMRTGIDGVDHADELDTSKLGRAITSLAALALLANKRGDPVGLLICGGKNVAHSYIPPTRSLATILFTLASVQSAGVANLQHNIEQLSHRIRSKSIVCVASDWMEEPHTWGPNLEILASMGHDIRVLQFFSEKEWNLELPESVQLFGNESREFVPVDTENTKENFRAVVAEYRREVQEWSAKSKALWIEAPLEQSLLMPLLRLVKEY